MEETSSQTPLPPPSPAEDGIPPEDGILDDDIFAPDPMMGDYIAHHPSNRQRLLIRAGVLYGVPILFLQVFFAELDDVLASIVLIGIFASLALAVAWYVLHNWNREVILYQRGFTYREGSQTVVFRYDEIITFRQRAERIRYAGVIRRDIYEFTLFSQKDERLFLNAVYQDIVKLGETLERFIAEARLPISKTLLDAGEALGFGTLIIDQEAISLVDADEQAPSSLAWTSYRGYRIERGMLWLDSEQAAGGLQIRLNTLDNLFLLILLLKSRQPA